VVQPTQSMAEFAARRDAIYEREVEPHLTSEYVGKFVAIDVESGAYEIGSDELTASVRLLARPPELAGVAAARWLPVCSSLRAARPFHLRVIRGTVSAFREELITLTVRGPAGAEQQVEAVIDTGFDGMLTFPSSVIAPLQLPWHGRVGRYSVPQREHPRHSPGKCPSGG